MKITIEIPKEYEQDFKDNNFSDALNRFVADVDYEGLAGNYEVEIANMLKEAFTKNHFGMRTQFLELLTMHRQ